MAVFRCFSIASKPTQLLLTTFLLLMAGRDCMANGEKAPDPQLPPSQYSYQPTNDTRPLTGSVPLFFIPKNMGTRILATIQAAKDNHGTILALYDGVCREKKPIGNLSININLIVPKPGKGIPLDIATQARNAYVEEARKQVHQFFAAVSTCQPPAQGSSQVHNGNQLAIIGDSSLRNQLLASELGIKLAPVFQNGFNSDAYPVFLSVLSDDDVYLGSPHGLTFINQDGHTGGLGNYVKIGMPFAMQLTEDWVPRILAMNPTPPTKRTVKQEGGKSKDDIVRPITEVCDRVLGVWRQNFVVMIPCSEQKKYFGQRDAVGCQDGHLSISQSVTDSQSMWKLYFDHLVSIKEAVTNNPQIIRFEATLDLKPFCAYARPVMDLVTQ